MIEREASTEYFDDEGERKTGVPSSREEMENLAKDLKVSLKDLIFFFRNHLDSWWDRLILNQTYQDLLYLHGVKDDRVRNPRMLRRSTLWKRLLVRIVGAVFLFVISIPGKDDSQWLLLRRVEADENLTGCEM